MTCFSLVNVSDSQIFVFVFKLVFVFEYSMDVGRWQSELLIGRRGTNVAANRTQLGRPIQTNSNQYKPIGGKGGFSTLTDFYSIFAILAGVHLGGENSVLDFYIYHEGHLLFPSVGQTVIWQIPRLIFFAMIVMIFGPAKSEGEFRSKPQQQSSLLYYCSFISDGKKLL